MKSMKPVIAVLITVAVAIVLIPALLVLPFSSEGAKGKLMENLTHKKQEPSVADQLNESSVEVAVYRSQQQKIQAIPLEKYVAGVVSAEMPADFEVEALKAQALTARTYIVNQLSEKDTVALPKGAHVTDTVLHQVYKSDDELKKLWGKDYAWKKEKIAKAVLATKDQILTYNGEPITATFFSTSNGFTENSEAYWKNSIPYLKSVVSPWDKDSPKFYDRKVISIKEFEAKLGVKLSQGKEIGTIVERTPGKRVGAVKINGKQLTGKQIRETLELKSTDFTWERKGDQIIISTKGYGHGVGMSQYGANGMAQEGKNYRDIVTYYYQGVQITSSTAFLNTIVANK
ncbi:stage II sporulation protein D [Peribacillus alkalitolerans]|uniref:stage II sporulation protein D n=1 Tax=Peribacillus alkalitolerans TaxID=1550385 RepID=UPI0013D44DFC|nr:stage II sporulation protein D [Peribacillus alkalitolerans]